MRRIYISSLYRSDDNLDGGDCLFVVDWDTKTVQSNIGGVDLWKKALDMKLDSPAEIKGFSKSMGARGLAWFQDHLWVSGSTSMLYKIDIDEGRVVASFDTNIGGPNAAIHQIREHNGFLYLVNTGQDSLTKFDGARVVEKVNVFDMPGVKELVEPLLPERHRHKEWGTDRVHFNSINWDAAGNEYHTYMRCQAIFDVTNLKVIASDLSCPHDIEIDGSSLFYSSSAERSLFNVDLSADDPNLTKHLWLEREIPQEEAALRKKYGSGHSEFPYISFVRGIELTSDGNLLFVSAAPGTLICLDRESGRSLGEVKYCNSRAEQPFDVLLDPRDWG